MKTDERVDAVRETIKELGYFGDPTVRFSICGHGSKVLVVCDFKTDEPDAEKGLITTSFWVDEFGHAGRLVERIRSGVNGCVDQANSLAPLSGAKLVTWRPA